MKLHIKNLFFLLILISCKNSKSNFQYKFKEKKFNIKIQNDEYPSSFLNTILEIDKKTYLFRKSSISNFIYVYDWDIKKRIKKIHFDDFGPNNIFFFRQASVLPLNKNEYYIGTINNIYLTRNDSITKHISLIKEAKSKFKYANYFMIFGKNSIPPIKYKNDIFYYLSPSNGKPNSLDYFKSKLILKFNINKNEYSKLDITFPKSYYNKCWPSNHETLSYTLNNNSNLVYLFSNNPTIYSYDIDQDKKLDSIKIYSKYATKILPIKCNTSNQEKLNHFGMSASYETITYDKFKNVYYLIIQLPLTIEQIKNTKNPFTLNPFSIIALDNKFNILTEKKYKGGIYNYTDFFITKQGLWLSKNSPHNPEYNENELHFALLNLERNVN